MRVTNNMLISNMMQNLTRNLRSLDVLERKLSSGKEVSRPSDDPARVSTALSLRNTVGEIKRYNTNIESAQSWLETYDKTLGSVEDVLQRAKELAVYGANGYLAQDSRNALAAEVDQLLDQVVTLSNTDYQGRYIFAGYKTTTVPFVKGPNATPPPATVVTYNGDTGSMDWEISPGMKVKVNLTGQDVFVNPAIFDTLINFSESLKSADIPTSVNYISNTVIADLDTAMNSIHSTFADLGAKINRLETTKARVEEQEANYTKLLSETEDADITKVIVDLKAQENVYRASLAAGARVIQPSLLDFLS